MAPRPLLPRILYGSSSFALAAAFTLGACGESDDAAPNQTGQGTVTGGQTGSGGSNAGGQLMTGGTSTTGGQVATGGKSTTGGQSTTGGVSSQGGQTGGQGPSGGTPSTTGGSPSGGASGGTAPSGGAQNGGVSGGGAAAGGASGSGGGSTECTRDLLDGLLDQYFKALSAGDPSMLPLAADVKFTENAEESAVGKTDFWMNAGDTKHSQRALDTTACSAAAQAVIPEGNTDLPVGIRIKVEAGELTEIETIVVRPGDYTASFAVDSDPAAIISISKSIGWHDEVPQSERASRQELWDWIDKYFRAFPSGVCNVTSACRRLENGGGNFSCRDGASCSGNTPTTGGAFEPRVIVVDEVRGIAAGFTIFDFMTTGHLDMHMMKMSGGEVHAVHAILRDTGGESGWD